MTRMKRVDGWWKSTGYSMNSPMSCKHEIYSNAYRFPRYG